MNTTHSLVAEMSTLRQAVKVHHDLLDEAVWQRSLAMEAAGVPVKHGCYVLDQKDEWRYPAVAEASRQVEALDDDNGYYWACSRLRDLDLLLGDGFNAQLPLRLEGSNYVPRFGGDIPEAPSQPRKEHLPMASKTVQLPRHQTPTGWRNIKRRIKRSTTRTLRRQGKKHLDDAPKSVIHGWAD